jgi:subtilisin family serine protease
LAAAFPYPSYAQEAERVLIQFSPGHKASVRQALEAKAADIHYEFDQLNVIAATVPGNSLHSIQSSAGVMMVEPDRLRYPMAQTVPYGIDAVEARDVWDTDRDGVVDAGAPTGAGRTVCIIDSGVDLDHEDFVGVNFIGGYPAGWDTDNYGHGTHVAGTIAAMNNGTGVVGVSPGTVSLYILKVFGDDGKWAYSSTLIDAAYRCRDAGANIISMSLGGDYYSSFENWVFQNLYDQGILSVAAAGNGGGTAYSYPASYDSVISVAAVDQNNVVASFSRRNDKVELAAPGVAIYSTYKNGTYVYMSGTSMATPHVAGAAAVAWSSDPSKTNAEIREALQQPALDLGDSGQDDSYGYGLIQTEQTYQTLGSSGSPTNVELASFEAVADDSSIRLEWETASEIDSLGFNLYRADAADGPQTQLNESLIPSQLPGSPVGAAYQFVDESVVEGATYYYWLEGFDVYGAATSHGPVSAALVQQPTVTLFRVFVPSVSK